MQQQYHFILGQGLRVKRTHEWHSTDTLRNYRAKTSFGPNLYAPGDFSYTFNERGYRCDSFAEEAEFPVMFTGCSNTEGVGLPVEHVWAYRLLEKIRAETGKKIPYWTSAQAGAGLDTMAFNLFTVDGFLSTKPKHIFCLNAPFVRRECMWKEPQRKRCLNRQHEQERLPDDVNNLLTDEWYGKHQVLRSCMIIDTIARSWGAKFYIGAWNYGGGVEELAFITKNFPTFVPVTLSDMYVHNKNHARDGIHYGPTYHERIAEDYWETFAKCL